MSRTWERAWAWVLSSSGMTSTGSSVRTRMTGRGGEMRMATRTVAATGEGADAVPRERSSVLPFTWVSVALGGLLVGGVFLDGWAHHHGRLDISLLGATNLSQAYAPPGLPATI